MRSTVLGVELLPAGDRLPPGPPRPPAPATTGGDGGRPPGGFTARRVSPAPFRRISVREWLHQAGSELRHTTWLSVPAAAYDAALVLVSVALFVVLVAGFDAGLTRLARVIF